MSTYADPARTLALLAELEALGFPDSAFVILHHHGQPQGITDHRRYCEMLAEEGATFRTKNNQLVQRRLEMVLAMYKAGAFASGAPRVFEFMAQAALLEVPHDRRPLAEQFE